MKPIILSEIKPVTLCAGFDSKLIHSNSMTWSFVHSKAGHTLPAHQHVHEQVTHIVHSGTSITDCAIIDVFNPVREDYAKLSAQ